MPLAPAEIGADLIDFAPAGVNVAGVDLDEILGRSPGDPLDALVAQDLDPLSIAELEARIMVLTREIERVRARIAHAANHRASADQLFRR